MTKTQVEVITSVERHRRWSRVEKERIVPRRFSRLRGCPCGGDSHEPVVPLASQLCEREQFPAAFNL
jgi:hypothetical protein